MPELHSNGIHEAYLAELFNPMVGGAAFNSGGGIGGTGIGSPAPWMSTYPQQAFPQQTLSQPAFSQLNTPWAQQPAQTGAIVQQIAAKQAVQAIQLSSVLQALQQIVHTIAVHQQHLVQALMSYAAQSQPGGYGTQTPFAQTPLAQSPFTSGGQSTPFGSATGQVPGVQPGVGQALQHQAMQQLLQYLGVQQPQTPFRYGMAV